MYTLLQNNLYTKRVKGGGVGVIILYSKHLFSTRHRCSASWREYLPTLVRNLADLINSTVWYRHDVCVGAGV